MSIGGSSNGYDLITNTVVLDSDHLPMVVGEEYEMYSPIAKMAHEQLGLVFDNPDNKFIYLGVMKQGSSVEYLASNNVSYDASKIPAEVFLGSAAIHKLFGAYPVCPLFVAAKHVRKATP